MTYCVVQNILKEFKSNTTYLYNKYNQKSSSKDYNIIM